MAESTFDRNRFHDHLRTRRLGRVLFTPAEVESTNDVAWERIQQGAGDGATVIADVQTRGRGRQGRVWYTGGGLAMSLVLVPGCDRAALGTAPLVAGVALAQALEELNVHPQLKWPNDLIVGDRKISGILVESRRDAHGNDVLVVGVGVNVSQGLEEFPGTLRNTATSLAREGSKASREQVAAGFLNALEPIWDEHQEGDPGRVLDEWQKRAAFIGWSMFVDTPAGRTRGKVRGVDSSGGLVLELGPGRNVTVHAGDLQIDGPPDEDIP